MRHFFYRKELQYLNQNLFSNKLLGIPQYKFPFLFVKKKLINEDILDVAYDNTVYVKPLYEEFFNDWINTNTYIMFKNNLGYIDMILYNDKKMITVEENVGGCEIGYFLYEDIGLKNYVFDRLGPPLTVNIDEDEFKLNLTQKEFEMFIDANEEYLNGISEKSNVHPDLLKNASIRLSNKPMKTALTIYDVVHNVSSDICIYPSRSGNCMLKKVCRCDDIQYIVLICDKKTLLNEVFSF